MRSLDAPEGSGMLLETVLAVAVGDGVGGTNKEFDAVQKKVEPSRVGNTSDSEERVKAMCFALR